MKKIILHIGTPKSGTSALQNFLNKNNSPLNKNNFCYPSDLDSKNTEITMGNGRILYEYAIKSNIMGARKYLDKILQEYDTNYIILSSEGFYFYPEFLYELIPDALVIVYFREQSETIVSSYGQRIKGDPSFQKTFPEYLETILNGKENKMFTQYFLDEWRKYYGDNMILRSYDFNQFTEGTIFTDFLYSIGIYNFEDFIVPEKKINPSYTRNALEYKLCLNKLMKGKNNRLNMLIRNLLQSYSEIYPEKQKISILTQEQQEQIIDYFKKTNSYIAYTYLQKNNGVLFSKIKRVNNGLEKYNGLSIDVIQNITRFIINREPILLKFLVNIIIDGIHSKNNETRKTAYTLLPVFSLYKIYQIIKEKNKN